MLKRIYQINVLKIIFKVNVLECFMRPIWSVVYAYDIIWQPVPSSLLLFKNRICNCIRLIFKLVYYIPVYPADGVCTTILTGYRNSLHDLIHANHNSSDSRFEISPNEMPLEVLKVTTPSSMERKLLPW